MLLARWAPALRMMVWVSVGLVTSGSGGSGARDAPPSSYGDKPRLRGADLGAFTLLGVFAFLEGAVRDLAQQARVMGQRADIAPVDLDGVGLEMIVDQRMLHSVAVILTLCVLHTDRY
jgi:hypothetical protein